jgi:hypothetical protein
MPYLVELGIAKQENGTTELFERLYPSLDLFPDVSDAALWMKNCWDYFESNNANRDLRGSFFEYLLAVLFVKKNLTPFTMQANLALIPSANYDFLFFTSNPRMPIVVSAKTSLREKYKQAELEAQALRNVFQQAKSYLISLNTVEVAVRKRDLVSGNLNFLTNVIDARSDEFNDFIAFMGEQTFVETTHLQVMKEGTRFIMPS